MKKTVALIVLTALGVLAYMMGGAEMLTIFVLLVLVLGAFLFAGWQLAKADTFYTFIAVGEIKTVDRGEGNVIRVLANLENNHVENMKIVPGAPRKTFMEKHFGMYWIGIPPATVHEFEFVHERVNPKIGKDTPASDWIQRDKTATKTRVLLWEIPHSYPVFGVELKDGFKMDILFESRSRVIDPVIAIYVRKGKFIDYMAQYVEAGLIEALREIDAVTFRSLSKNEGSELARKILENIDPQFTGVPGLPEAVGLTMVGGFISRWGASDPSEELALAAKKKAELEGEARVMAAKQNADAAVETRRGMQNLAGGHMAGLEAALDIIKNKTPGISDADALEQATALAIATKMSDPQSPVTVLGASINVGITPERKARQ